MPPSSSRVDVSFSEPPINSSMTPNDQRPVTFPDVMMRIAHDGPFYAIICLIGVLAIRGTASAQETVIASLGTLLARSWPRAIQVAAGKAGVAIMILGFGASVLAACWGP